MQTVLTRGANCLTITAAGGFRQEMAAPTRLRNLLVTHCYGNHDNVRQMRTMEHVCLINFVPLQPLKSAANFLVVMAMLVACQPFNDYLSKYCCTFPADCRPVLPATSAIRINCRYHQGA